MKNMRAVFFYGVIGFFFATALLTLLGIVGVVKMPDRFLDKLFFGVVLELLVAVVGLFKATDWFGKNKQVGCEEVECGWWQVVSASDDANVFAFVHIDYSDESGQLKLEGDAFTAEGKPHSRFWSISGALNPSTWDLYYFWEGDNQGSNENYSGIGNIKFEGGQGSPRSAVGWFTTGDLDVGVISDRRKVQYLRATREETAVMRNRENPAARGELVVRKRGSVVGAVPAAVGG